MAKYIVESIGYNDGLPYYQFSTDNLEEAKDFFEKCRVKSPKVPWRLIEVVEWKPSIE